MRCAFLSANYQILLLKWVKYIVHKDFQKNDHMLWKMVKNVRSKELDLDKSDDDHDQFNKSHEENKADQEFIFLFYQI